MTVLTTHVRENHIGDGVQTVFTFSFQVMEINSLVVFLDDLQVFVGITISLNADQIANPGGDVTFSAPPEDESKITLVRVLIANQLIDFKPYGSFAPDVTEGAMDRVVMLAQQIKDGFDRSVALPPGEALAITKGPGYEQGGHLAWDNAGRLFTNWVCNCENIVDRKRRAYGRIGADGTIVKGSGGFTVTINGTGNHTINFEKSVSEGYVVIVGLASGSGPSGWGATVFVTDTTANGFTINTLDDNTGIAVSRDYAFILRYTGEFVSRRLTIVNPGFEFGITLPGWTPTTGNPEAITDAQGGVIKAHKGDWFLGSNVENSGEWYVRGDFVDLLAAGISQSNIDNGLVEITVDWYQRSVSSNNDPGRVGLAFHDSSFVQIGLTEYSSLIGSPFAWNKRSFTFTAPPNTQYVAIIVNSKSNIGAFPSAFFDTFSIAAEISGQ